MAKTATSTAGKYQYAGFWIRLLAAIIDMIVVSIIGYILYGSQVVQVTSGSIHVGFNGWKSLIPFLYIVLFWIWISATPGKRVLGLKVVNKDDGQKISWKTAIIRCLGYIPSFVIFGIGYLWIAFDKEKRGWHDLIAKTVVIKQ